MVIAHKSATKYCSSHSAAKQLAKSLSWSRILGSYLPLTIKLFKEMVTVLYFSGVRGAEPGQWRGGGCGGRGLLDRHLLLPPQLRPGGQQHPQVPQRPVELAPQTSVHRSVQYSTVQYSTVELAPQTNVHRSVQYSTVQYSGARPANQCAQVRNAQQIS